MNDENTTVTVSGYGKTLCVLAEYMMRGATVGYYAYGQCVLDAAISAASAVQTVAARANSKYWWDETLMSGLTNLIRHQVRSAFEAALRAQPQYRELKRRSAAQREDAAHKWAVKVCRNSDAIASEDFKPGFLFHTTMARKAHDAAIGKLMRVLEWQAAKRGRIFVKINPAHTTQDCSNCGARAKRRLNLQERVYKCERCGLMLDRDRNSAINMLIGAGFIPGPMGTLSRSNAAARDCAVPERSESLRL